MSPIPKTAPFAEEEINLLNRVVGPANAVQRAWLAGFLDGLDASQGVEGGAVAAGRGGAAASGRAADDCLCQRVRQLRKACQRSGQSGAQERAQAQPDRHGG